MDTTTPAELKNLLMGDDEFALIDIREQGRYSEAHLLFAVCIPFSRLELMIANLVPRLDTLIIIVAESADDPLGQRAAARLEALGYQAVTQLQGGLAGWQDHGLEVFSGINVPSKAFGEFIEATCETPRLPAEAVKAMLDEGRDMVIVDSRPLAEYHRMNIPTAVDMPGAELVYRIHELAPNPETTVVVNCAGRTRSIIGAQSLINAGIPNPVVALKDGTMGWHLAGFNLEHGSEREAGKPGETGLQNASAAASRVAQRFNLQKVASNTVAQWRNEADRTTYLLDVRSPAEYLQGHLPGYRNAPGGQLVQATDEYVAVKNARLVLADETQVRSTMTASWLVQMGWQDVYVLADDMRNTTLETGMPDITVPVGLEPATITGAVLASMLDNIALIDLAPSSEYERRHIPGATWCVRARLADALAKIPVDQQVVLTSTDGQLAQLALPDARALHAKTEALSGGTEAWLADNRDTVSGLTDIVGPLDDIWYKPYDHRSDQEKFMREYLTWEVALVEQIERDGTTRFRTF